MTQEHKDLLLKDISARLPYRVHVFFDTGRKSDKDWIMDELDDLHLYWLEDGLIKPYLRPMSSMTEEENEEFRTLIFPEASYAYEDCLEWDAQIIGGGYLQISVEDFSKVMDWLNAHHFDYRGLIEKGLALEASEGMYEF